jgi:hypothetical protein
LEIPNERLRIVCAGLGGSGSGSHRSITAMLTEQLAARGLALDASLPFDGRALQRAERRALPLAAAARRRGAYARALRGLIDQLFLPSAVAKARERKLRLPLPQPTQPREQEMSLP